jgi:hypothetical protein
MRLYLHIGGDLPINKKDSKMFYSFFPTVQQGLMFVPFQAFNFSRLITVSTAERKFNG